MNSQFENFMKKDYEGALKAKEEMEEQDKIRRAELEKKLENDKDTEKIKKENFTQPSLEISDEMWEKLNKGESRDQYRNPKDID